MGGFPLVNGLAVAALLCAVLLPLTALTGRGTRASLPPAPGPAGPTTDERPARATLKFAHCPESAVLLHLDRVLWSLSGFDANEADAELLLPAFDPQEGIELLLEVRWPHGTPETVVEVTLEPESLDGRSHTVWGTEELAELAVFTWPDDMP